MGELEERFEADADRAAACVFCDYKDPEATKPINLIANLLSQILERQHTLPEILLKLFEKEGKTAPKPSLENMKDIFHDLAGTRDIYLIVDAVDECPLKGDSRDILLQQLSHLHGICNILLTSRPSVSISRYFGQYHTIEITANESDIDLYIAGHLSSRLQSHIKKNLSLHQEITSIVKERAQNMYVSFRAGLIYSTLLESLLSYRRFLLVKLHMDSLSSKQTPNAVRKALQTLPTGIFATYDDVLRRIEDQNEDDRELARKTLMWLSLSQRPLQMKELQHAVTINESFHELDEDDIPSAEIIVSVCAGLVSPATGSNFVQLVHFTAQEYFSQKHVQQTLFADGQRQMFSSCLTYLLLDDFVDRLSEGKKIYLLWDMVSRCGFFHYAAHNWGHHARAAHLDQTDQERILCLLGNERRVVSLIDVLHMESPPGLYQGHFSYTLKEADGQGLWLASYFGLTETINRLLENGATVKARVVIEVTFPGCLRGYRSFWNRDRPAASSNRTALTVAAWSGHASIVELLLKKGAKIKKLDLNGAVYNQHREVVDILLRHGAPINNDDDDEYDPPYYSSASDHLSSLSTFPVSYAPIHWCAHIGNLELMKLLLAKGADVHSRSAPQADTPLIIATRAGHASIVRILLDHNAGVNGKNAHSETAMLEACKYGYSEITKLLLAKGASLNIPDAESYDIWQYGVGHSRPDCIIPAPSRHKEYKTSGGNTAFEYALKYERYDILQLLLDADPASALSGKALVPLPFAAKINNVLILLLLLRYGADVNARDKFGRTALYWAVTNDCEEMTSILLDEAPEIDASDENGLTPLHIAAQSASPNVLRQLIRNGASLSLTAKSTGKLSSRRNFEMAGRHKGSTPLHQAVRWINISNVPLLIEAGADMEARDARGRTPFFLAVECSRSRSHDDNSHDAWPVAELLISRGAIVDSSDNDGVTPLMRAVECWDRKLVQLLLRANADANAVDNNGRSAAHVVFSGRPLSLGSSLSGLTRTDQVREILEVLGLYGADFNARDKNGNTPLSYAVQSDLDGLTELLDLMVKFGANISSTNNSGSTLLHLAVSDHYRVKSNWPTVMWLLDAGVPVDARNRSEETALLVAAGGICSVVIRLLGVSGADITARDLRGKTALAKCLGAYPKDEYRLEMAKSLIALGAVVKDFLRHDGGLVDDILGCPSEIVDLLVSKGMDVNAPDEYGELLLLEASSQNDVELAQWLLDAGARVAAADSRGITALHKSARAGKVTMATILVSSGAKVAQQDNSGQTPLHLALNGDRPDMISYLTEQWIAQGCFDSAKELMYMALAKGLFSCARMIGNAHNPENCNLSDLEELYDIAATGASGTFTALVRDRANGTDQIWLTGLFRVAICLNRGDILQALIDHKLDIDGRDPAGDSALHIAARLGSEDIVAFLLDSGAEVELQNRHGYTPLLLAARAQPVGALVKLIERGADVSQRSRKGSTALHLTNSLEAARALISAGASINALDNERRTPLHYQVSAGNMVAIVRYLLEVGADVNSKDSNGDSPIHIASAVGAGALKLLLGYHPDMTLMDGAGRTPSQIAELSGDNTSIKIIEEYLGS